MKLGSLRHNKEEIYGTIAMVVGGLFWLMLLFGTSGGILFTIIPLAITLFIADQVFRVVIFGDAVRVSERQFSDINGLVRQCASDMGLDRVPHVFVVNSAGMANALAVKFLSTRYVILYSQLIDLMDAKKMGMVVAHELAHHAAGHVNFWKKLLMVPAHFVPFLGAAYSRACELTADRIAASWLRDHEASKSALLALACGSMRLSQNLNIEAFREQEAMVPPIIGFIYNLFSPHPRMTSRIIELDEFFRDSVGYSHTSAQGNWPPPGNDGDATHIWLNPARLRESLGHDQASPESYPSGEGR